MLLDFAVILDRLVDQFADREALVNSERDRRFTFAELQAVTNRIANMMHEELGMGAQDRYFCILENDNLSLLSFPTVFKGHGCVTWTNVRDAREEHLAQIDHVEPKAVFIESSMLADYLPDLTRRGIIAVAMDGIPDGFAAGPLLRDFWPLVDASSPLPPGTVHDDRADTVIMRFTGGTTGLGKCAMYSMDNWLACRDSFYAIPGPVFEPGERFLHIAPISHGSGLMILPTMFRGGCMITMNNPDLAEWCRIVARERATATFLVPTLAYRLLELEAAKEADLSSMRTFIYAAAPMSPTKLELLQERFGNVFVQAYAATEHLVMGLAMTKADHLVGSGESTSKLAAAGKPVPGIELLICDDNGAPVATGEVGEIWMRSRGVCQGYFRNPEQTEAEFERGFWKSGDIARQDEAGFVYLVDRKKNVIISGGFNVYANEVEAALSAHPSVLMVAVVGVPHPDWGEAVHAEIVLRDGAVLDEDELKAFVKQRLGAQKAPKTIAAVPELPLSSAGKILHRKVREKYWAGQERNIS